MIMITSRIILFLALSFLLFRIIRRSRIQNKKAVTIASVVLCLCLLSLSAVFPVENGFVHFRSAEAAFRYSSRGTIEHVIHGSDSCMVVYSTGPGAYNDAIFPMSEQGYQLPNFYGIQETANEGLENGSFEVLRLRGSDNYYVRGVVVSENDDIQAVDCNGNAVCTIRTGDDRATLFYAWADTYETSYSITVNGQQIVISQSPVTEK